MVMKSGFSVFLAYFIEFAERNNRRIGNYSGNIEVIRY